MNMTQTIAPWYRHRWPWILMLAPLSAMMVCGYFAWLAIKTADPLVANDYYAEGKAINAEIERYHTAAALNLSAAAHWEGRQLGLDLKAGKPFVPPAKVTLKLAHSTLGDQDQIIELVLGPNGMFTGAIAPLSAGRWDVTLQDVSSHWQLSGSLKVPGQTGVQLKPQ
jgi:hypothetical protein